MAIVFDSDAGTITGISVGGLPDGVVDAGTLATDSVTAAKIAANAVVTGKIADDAVDFVTIRNDIASLALHSAVADNKAAYNLPNSFIDQFENDTGLATQTDVNRNASEYVIPVATSAAAAFTSDSNTLALLHFDGGNNSTTITDSSSHSRTITRTVTEGARPKLDTGEKKFGTAACQFGSVTATYGTHGNALSMGDSSHWNFSTNEFTFETWIYPYSGQLTAAANDWPMELGGQATSNTSDSSGGMHWTVLQNGKVQFNCYRRNGSSSGDDFTFTSSGSISEGEWSHVAITRDGNVLRHYINGVASGSHTLSTVSGGYHLHVTDFGGDFWISRRAYNSNYGYIGGLLDEYRLSNTCRYPNGTTFTPNTTQTIGATGTLISTVQTASSAQTKVSGVILYKNNAGTATLGTDLKVYFTCNNGTNWTESTPVASGTLSTGILMAKCPEVTCTSGTDVRYKVVWANQSAGSKETQLHGIAMNY